MIHHVLQVTSSIFGDSGQSSLISTALIETLRRRQPDIKLSRRHLAADSIPHLDQETFAAFGTAPATRSLLQQQQVELSDILIGELKQADLLVLGLPMYNFAVPSTVKAWFDHLGRAGLTFRYTEQGSEGLLQRKRAVVIASRGGRYSTESDRQTPYVNHFLSFIGINRVDWVYVEGLAMGEESATAARRSAASRIEAIAEDLLAAGLSA